MGCSITPWQNIHSTIISASAPGASGVRRGFINDIQDLDLARTCVLLPQGMYNARWRDSYLSLDGGEFFGTFPMSVAGDASYELYTACSVPNWTGVWLSRKPTCLQTGRWFGSMLPRWPASNSGGTPPERFRAGVALNKVWNLSF